MNKFTKVLLIQEVALNIFYFHFGCEIIHHMCNLRTIIDYMNLCTVSFKGLNSSHFPLFATNSPKHN